MSTKIKRRNLSQTSELIYDIHEHCINTDSREIFLHSNLYLEEEKGVDFAMAVQFEKNMRLLNKLGDLPILVHMHTIGGEWEAGMAIYDTIKYSKSPVVIVAYANARSMSSIILQAATEHGRIMMPSSVFMYHHGTMGHEGHTIEYLTVAKELEKSMDTMLDIYVNKCQYGEIFTGWTDKRIRNQLKKEMEQKMDVYLNADETVEHGFADAVIGTEGYETIEDALTTVKHLMDDEC
jgi:ATP-dependent protease ClpP protease subunit